MDPINPNGEILDTPDGSQPEIITADEGTQVNPEGASDLSTEEVAFNSLKGSTQERVRTLAKRANDATQLQAEVEQLKADMEALRLRSMTPAPEVNPDVRDAVSKLDGFGLATKDYTNKTIDERVNQKLSGIVWNMEMDRLEGRHNGQDGLPAFDRSEYEAFINANPDYRGYKPEDVYTKMFEEDIFDARVKGKGTTTQLVNKQAPNLRATRTRVQEEAMTPEYIEQKLASLPKDERMKWYTANLSKINEVTARQPSTE